MRRPAVITARIGLAGCTHVAGLPEHTRSAAAPAGGVPAVVEGGGGGLLPLAREGPREWGGTDPTNLGSHSRRPRNRRNRSRSAGPVTEYTPPDGSERGWWPRAVHPPPPRHRADRKSVV